MGLFALQCLFGAAFHAFHAQNALRAVFAAAGIVGNVYLHGADLFAFAAGDAFAVVALHPKQGEITHGLEKNRNGTDILTESPVVMEPERQKNAHGIIKAVAQEKGPKENGLFVLDAQQKQGGDEAKGGGEDDIAYPPNAFSGPGGGLVGQEIQHHGGPAGIAAPAPPENQRPKDFGNGIVNGGSGEAAAEQIVPKALQLHVFPADNP